jgi:hypothetical protein
MVMREHPFSLLAKMKRTRKSRTERQEIAGRERERGKN